MNSQSTRLYMSLTLAALSTGRMVTKANAEEDILAPYRVTQVTETVNRNEDGMIVTKDVVRESRIDIREKTTEAYAVDEFDQLRVIQRHTFIQNTQGDSVTIVEELRGDPAELVVTSRITVSKDTAGNAVSVSEARDQKGPLRVVKRVMTKKVRDQLVTTVQTPNKDGQLVVSQTITKQ